MIGALASGATGGAFTALAPLFAERIHLDTRATAVFLAAMVVGPALAQWPLGRLGDHYGRREGMLLAMLIAILGQVGLYTFAHSELWVLVFFSALVGGASYPLYQMSSSLAVDAAGNNHAVTTSSTLALAYAVGAVIGPALGGEAMAIFGPEALFGYTALIHIALCSFLAVELSRREVERG
jgi:MFS family permease